MLLYTEEDRLIWALESIRFDRNGGLKNAHANNYQYNSCPIGK
ncbi:hypothetical protein DSBG_0192 [Desulfosporosinus sp. BG]|nr:hypothetical protein DSBG_0192 [Desulfosporosinus sp. BG]